MSTETAWVRDLWQRVRPHALAQAAELEHELRACMDMSHGHACHEIASDIAHRLSGSLGSYGLADGSQLAVAIQRRLRDGSGDHGQDRGATVLTLATRLRHVIECA